MTRQLIYFCSVLFADGGHHMLSKFFVGEGVKKNSSYMGDINKDAPQI